MPSLMVWSIRWGFRQSISVYNGLRCPCRWYASSRRVFGGKSSPRQRKIEYANMQSQAKLYNINNKFNLFHRDVFKILDLGYVPGNWLEFARYKMCEVHELDEFEINTKCDLLGFDLLFGVPPIGTSSIQGNIFSKLAHGSIIQHFKDMAVRRRNELSKSDTSELDDLSKSYYAKEQSEIEMIESNLQDLSLNQDQQVDTTEKLDYKVDLILSDLTIPFQQERGYFNNTNTRPYLRFGNHAILNRPITESTKSAIDMADATLVLACDLLKLNGNLLLRLASVDKYDEELQVVMDRCYRLFDKVSVWPQADFFEFELENDPTIYNRKPEEVFLICQGKKDVEKLAVFKE